MRKVLVLIGLTFGLIVLGWMIGLRRGHHDAPRTGIDSQGPAPIARAAPEEALLREGLEARGDRAPLRTWEQRDLGAPGEFGPTVVLVQDPSGRAVSGAGIWCRENGIGTKLGTSNEEGRAVVELPEQRDIELSAVSDAWRSEDLPLDPPFAPEILLIVEPAGWIQGLVTSPEEVPVPGCRVIAFESTEGFGVADLERLERDGRRPAVVTTDASGAFRIERLRRTDSYCLVAGGDGFLTSQATQAVRPCEGETRLVVERGFAAVIELRETGGAPIRVPERMIAKHLGRITSNSSSARTLHHVRIAAHLAGLDPELLRGQDPDTRVFLYAGPTDEERLGPLEFQADVPGYHRAGSVVWAHPIHRPPVRNSVELAPLDQGFGRLVVELVHEGRYPAPETESVLPLGFLELRRGTDEISYSVREADFVSGRVELEHVPQGTYELSLKVHSKLLQVPRPPEPPLEVVISEVERRIALRLGALGALELDVYRSDGMRHRSRATFYVAPAASVILEPGGGIQFRGGTVQSFANAPYVFRDLPEGDWAIMPTAPFGADGFYLQNVRIEPGELSTLTFVEAR